VTRSEQRVARAEIGEHTLAGVGDEDHIELHALGLMKRREGDAIGIAVTERDEGLGLEVLGSDHRGVGRQPGSRIPLAQAVEGLGER
jgi:hypothetical protein